MSIGCNSSDTDIDSNPIEDVIRTTSAPVDALTREIVQDLVPIELLCPESEDPSSWRPAPETISQYQRARLIITNGAGYESWVQTAPLPRSRVVDASSAIKDPLIIIQGESHSHGPEGSHSHDTTLGTVWLDPLNAISQAEVITAALAAAYPEYSSELSTNLSILKDELTDLHLRIKNLETSGLNIIAPLNPYGYLAKRYGWNDSAFGSSHESWPMEVHAGSITKPTLILCEHLPAPEEADALYQAYQIRGVHWKTFSPAHDASFIETLTENIDELELSLESFKD